jgi:hypothetical protein
MIINHDFTVAIHNICLSSHQCTQHHMILVRSFFLTAVEPGVVLLRCPAIMDRKHT